jgi:hypothetical protein
MGCARAVTLCTAAPALAQENIDLPARTLHIRAMSNALSPFPEHDEDAAELAAMTEAVDRSRANNLGVPHAEMREWLLEIASGNFDAEPPVSRKL